MLKIIQRESTNARKHEWIKNSLIYVHSRICAFVRSTQHYNILLLKLCKECNLL